MNKSDVIFFAAWLVALVATVGSLFFSEVMMYIPCSLCWYQRIFMYPIAILLTVGFFRSDKKALTYVAPLVVLGLLTALYHNLLMWEIIPETASPCRSGVPCSVSYVKYFGFITIPFMSLSSFSLLSLFIVLSKEKS